MDPPESPQGSKFVVKEKKTRRRLRLSCVECTKRRQVLILIWEGICSLTPVARNAIVTTLALSVLAEALPISVDGKQCLLPAQHQGGHPRAPSEKLPSQTKAQLSRDSSSELLSSRMSLNGQESNPVPQIQVTCLFLRRTPAVAAQAPQPNCQSSSLPRIVLLNV
jgi:hypothetical protein